MIDKIIYEAGPSPEPCAEYKKTANDALEVYKGAKETHKSSQAKTKQERTNWTDLEVKVGNPGHPRPEDATGLHKDVALNEANEFELGSKLIKLDYDLLTYGPLCYIPWYCSSLKTKIEICKNNIKANKDKLKENKAEINKIVKTDIPEAIRKINAASKQEDIDKKIMNKLEDIYNDTARFYANCLKAHPNLHLHVELNSSCKEIKQKMKTIEQKIKNTNIKSIDLMYGTGTLDSLELEKSLSDSKVTLIKNLLEELDKMKPSVPQESYSSFLTVYNEAKADLNSYKSERKMFKNKIKNASRKQKNILVNLPKLENSLSKIIKKLVNCENPLLS